MKICGCNSCRKNGEVDPHDLFDVYLAQKEEAKRKEFENIFLASYDVLEIAEIYNELSDDFKNSDVVNRINQYSDKPFDAENYWLSYGGSLNAFKELN